MITLLPPLRIICSIAILYAATIICILVTLNNPALPIWNSVIFAFKGASILNVLLFTLVSFGWRILWKVIPAFNRLIFPDLNGEWDMTIHWQWGEKKGTALATAHIKQNFLTISMEVAAGDSDSITLLAKPKKDPESGRPMLYYIYRNTPKRKNNNEPSYDGTAVLKLDHTSFNLLEGNYYTDRPTQGFYELKRRIST